MALKKSQLYSSLWQSCDELRGGMDASQYKDYILVMLFLKYLSDVWKDKRDQYREKYKGDEAAYNKIINNLLIIIKKFVRIRHNLITHKHIC